MKYLSPLLTVNETSVSADRPRVRSPQGHNLWRSTVTISDYMNYVDMSCFFCWFVQNRY